MFLDFETPRPYPPKILKFESRDVELYFDRGSSVQLLRGTCR